MDDNVTTTTFADDNLPDSNMPDWLTRLIERLMQVITKLLVKLGIKTVL